jgi:hypothetical protein
MSDATPPPCNEDGHDIDAGKDHDADAVTGGPLDEESFEWLRVRVLSHAEQAPAARWQAARDQALAWLMLESRWDAERLAAALGWSVGRVKDHLRYARYCRFLDPNKTAWASEGTRPAAPSGLTPKSRADARRAARKDRRCAFCGGTFTPRNSLGRTCSTRCRVALHRRQADR